MLMLSPQCSARPLLSGVLVSQCPPSVLPVSVWEISSQQSKNEHIKLTGESGCTDFMLLNISVVRFFKLSRFTKV